MNTPLRMRVMSDYYSLSSPCSTVVEGQVEDYTVTIQPNTTPPTARFYANNTTTCNGIINFTDSSSNAVYYLWSFGDGAISTVKNPSHTYTKSGTYTVKELVCNTYGCDSLTKSNYITVNTGGPINASCTPATSSYCCGMGIYNVSFNTINNTTNDGKDGYKDYSCTQQTTVTVGQTYSLSVTTGTTYNENVQAWIDYNNNGIFENSELVLTSNNAKNHSISITLPFTATLNTPLRMRVGSDYNTQPLPSPCTNVQYGQFEDYSVTIVPNTIPPVADFTSVITNTCKGMVSFTDKSTNTPTSWLWNFGDGTTDTVQNPTHIYKTAGTYTVVLTVTNPYGTDVHSTSIIINSLYANIIVADTLDQGTSYLFNTDSVGATSWTWNFGDGYSAVIQSPKHAYADTGTFVLSLTVANASGCAAIATKSILVTRPHATITGSTTICAGESTTLTATGGTTYKWETNDTTASIVVNPNITTSYFVVAYGKSYTDTARITVTVNPLPTVDAGQDKSIAPGESTQLSAKGAVNYVWTPATGLSDANIANPVVMATVTTSYKVTGTDANGCAKSDIVLITVATNCKNFYIPNAFSPNGNHTNDTLFVRSQCAKEIKEFYFVIHDRWGKQVFESNDITKGWDGIFNGRAMNTQVFGYYLHISLASGETVEQKGNISLIR